MEEIYKKHEIKVKGKCPEQRKVRFCKTKGLILLILLIIPLVSSSLGTYKQNDCVNIKTILNVSSVNISTISYPNSTLIISNKAMTKSGQTFNYTFCNTSALGVYVYDYFDNEGNVYVNDFLITPTGYEPSISQSITMFIIIGILLISIVLFFIFGLVTRYIPAKLICLSLSVILIVFTIGYILNLANITIGEYTSLTEGFTPLYVVFTALLGAGGLGIFIYLLVTVFQNFQKTRFGIGE